MSRILFLDFEFHSIVESEVGLVCCATFDPHKDQKYQWWLHKLPKACVRLAEYLKTFDTIIAYSAVAEARSFLALGLDPLKFNWVDLFLEYRMMTNHNDKLNWGKQLVDGKVKYFAKPKPKWERTEDDNEAGFRPTHSLAEATFKLTGLTRDTVQKTKMRDLIISAPEKFTKEQAKDIMDYCLEDVVFLPKIWRRLREEFVSMFPDPPDMIEFGREAILRGRYSAHTALMENYGYPIDVKKTKNFSKQVGVILHDLQKEINELFPDIRPFRWNKKDSRFSWDQKVTRAWIEANHESQKWLKTDSGRLSLALEAFQKFYDYKHDYPKDNFGAQIVRFLKLKQSLYGFSESTGSGRKSFWDSVGSDGRARAYMNHYGAQSSRSQPAASGFMFLKPAWMRALVVPERGKFLASIDYGQQEFFISALESGDQHMIEAYLSGDPYLHTAKLCKAVPDNATKESHKGVRDLFKNTTLGISYLMTKYGLSAKLTMDTGREWSEDEAQEQIDLFYEAYPDLKDFQEETVEEYTEGGSIKLPCGWWMWPDNPNPRSVANVPIQGFGASVMRLAVDMAVAWGVKVLFTLHDAIYMEGDVGDEIHIVKLAQAMKQAFVSYVDSDHKKVAEKIKLDPFAWSPNYKRDSEKKIGAWVIPTSDLYIDERAQDDYNRFSKYFEMPETDLL